MTKIPNLNFNKLYQAYLLVGDGNYWRDFLDKELKKFLQIENISSCPDIWCQSYDSFGIKEAHSLIEKEARRSFSGRGRFFILSIDSATPEAQNALLKTFEEPAFDTHFFIISHSAEIFLPTLCSRLIILNQLAESDNERTKEFPLVAKFLELDLPDRLDFIQKEFLKNKDKSKSEIISFVSELEKIFYSRLDLLKISKEEELIIHELEKSLRYLQNPRSSNRLILEHLALILG